MKASTGWRLGVAAIAVDQYFGSQADPNTAFASAGMSPAFLAWALIGIVPLALALRPLQRAALRSTEGVS